MNALSRLFHKPNPGRELGELAANARKRAALMQHEKMLATTRKLRAEQGLPPSPALEPNH